MSALWTEIIQADQFIVERSMHIGEYERKMLLHLYQPLVGSVAISLYETLMQFTTDEPLTHHYLTMLLQCPMKVFYEARSKLEAIGLLRVYTEPGDIRLFVYEVVPPLSAEQFFSDALLNVFLFNRVGQNVYKYIRDQFVLPKEPEKKYEITKAFSDVFTPLTAQELAQADQWQQEDDRWLAEAKGTQPNVQSNFDFALFQAGLIQQFVTPKALRRDVKQLIEKLAFMYDIGPLEMQNLVLQALEDDDINEEKLRKAARDWYAMQFSTPVPTFVAKQDVAERKVVTKEDELVVKLERLSPRELMIAIGNGAEPSKADLKIIDDIVAKQKLSLPVVNVLIYYVMLKADMKLQKSYVEKIASHWARKKVVTVQEAMALARDEHRQYDSWKPKTRTTGRGKKEPIPTWMQEAAAQPTEPLHDESFDEEAERQKLMALLMNNEK